MSQAANSIRIGTRGSELARWQAEHVAQMLRAVYPGIQVLIQVIRTRGDAVLDKPLPQIGGKGVFTAEIEAALRACQIDLAVHSLKDLPTDPPDGLAIGAIPARENVADVLVSRFNVGLADLPNAQTIGTSSRRRAAQILAARPDLRIVDLRGNIPTRLEKALQLEGPYGGAVMAYAGLARLRRLDAVAQVLPLDLILPAPGQGALAVQCRDDAPSRELLAPLNDAPTRLAVSAERAFLAGLGGGCALPIAAAGELAEGRLSLRGRVLSPDGSRRIDVASTIDLPEQDVDQLAACMGLGYQLAGDALRQGAALLLDETA